MKYISNAFSLQMLNTSKQLSINIEPVTVENVKKEELISVVGHSDTANILSNMLDKHIEMNRCSIKLNEDDVLYVAQVIGGRLPEGCTVLPKEMQIVFLKVTIQ